MVDAIREAEVKKYPTGRAFILRREIATSSYVFHAGMYVRAERDGKHTYTIWPPNQDFAYVIQVPRRMLRPVKRYARKPQ